MKSLEQKLYEAYQNGHGVRLSKDEVISLVRDDAVGARITNTACEEDGMPPAGLSCVLHEPTWLQFKKHLRGQQ